jgi:hypothetical protein
MIKIQVLFLLNIFESKVADRKEKIQFEYVINNKKRLKITSHTSNSRPCFELSK